MKERVQKLMAQANIASRRAAEEMIREGRVKVNGQVITIGDKADPEADTITVDGERLKFSVVKRYIAYNKPVNVLSAPASDHDDDRQTVREMIPVEGHLFTIGRLDAESDGLIVLTDDGELANKLMHPRYEHTKTYKVTVYGSPSQETLDRWEHGVFLEEGRTAPCSIRVQGKEADTTTLRIVMIEGKNRQIRRVAALLGHPVRKLTRTHLGQLAVGTLRWGEWVELTPEDVEAMKTPASDLSYIKRLKREIRAMRGKGYASGSRQEQSFTDTPRPSTFKPRAARPDSQRSSTARPLSTTRQTSHTRPERRDRREEFNSDDDRPRSGRPGQRPVRRDKREGFASDDDRPRSPRPGQRPVRRGNREGFASDDDRPRSPRPGQRPVRRDNREGFASDDDRPRPTRPGQRPFRRDKREEFTSDDERPRSSRPGQRRERRPDDANGSGEERDRPRPRRPNTQRPGTGTGGGGRGKPGSSPRSGGIGGNAGGGKPRPGGKPKPGGNRGGSNRPASNRPTSKRRKP